MGRRKLKDQEIEQFRSTLMDTALRLFAKEGYKTVSTRSLAAAAGCSAMTPYRYFKDKAAIFDACRCRAFTDFAQSQERVAEQHLQPMTRLKALGQAYANYATDNPDAFRLMFELDQSEQSSKGLVNAEHRAFNTLRVAVSEAVQQGVLKGDPANLAHFFWASLHGIVILDLSNKLIHGRSKHTLLKSLFDGDFTSAKVS